MQKVKRGRPKAGKVLKKVEILEAALELLDESGPKGLSMRSLAEVLKITPMSLYHHFDDRSALLCGISDMVYGEVFEDFTKFEGTNRERLEFLLLSYQRAVLRHPNLSLSIFESRAAFSEEAERITKAIGDLLEEAKIAVIKKAIWLNILVDFTHGSSIATAMNGPVLIQREMPASSEVEDGYHVAIRELLSCLFD